MTIMVHIISAFKRIKGGGVDAGEHQVDPFTGKLELAERGYCYAQVDPGSQEGTCG
jgi:hypothetical protein